MMITTNRDLNGETCKFHIETKSISALTEFKDSILIEYKDNTALVSKKEGNRIVNIMKRKISVESDYDKILEYIEAIKIIADKEKNKQLQKIIEMLSNEINNQGDENAY